MGLSMIVLTRVINDDEAFRRVASRVMRTEFKRMIPRHGRRPQDGKHSIILEFWVCFQLYIFF
jgi:hypothetical protein